MPTHDETGRFFRDWRALSPQDQALFMAAAIELDDDLSERRRIRASLRTQEVQAQPGVFELSWSGAGRATFQRERGQQPGDAHILWRRVGGAEILNDP